jgi:putative spermidine/putrescine transport system ATP-binding protein
VAVEARTADGTGLHLRTPQRLAPGDAITLTSDPERLLVFPADADRPPSESDSRPDGEHVTAPAEALS